MQLEGLVACLSLLHAAVSPSLLALARLCQSLNDVYCFFALWTETVFKLFNVFLFFQ
jgi:hypothetical protein